MYEKVKRNIYAELETGTVYTPTGRNFAEDLKEFHIPQERMHNSNLHDWGIARGLDVSGAIGGTEVVIEAGVAIDGSGQIISLSDYVNTKYPNTNAHGYIGSTPVVPINEKSVPVHLPISSAAGKIVYVTIQFLEIMRSGEGCGGRMEQVPWIQIFDGHETDPNKAYKDDGKSIILAIAKIDPQGKLEKLMDRDDNSLDPLLYRRHLIGETIEELRIRRPGKVADKIQDITSGWMGPGDSNGLKITVPNAGDKLNIRADKVVVTDSGGNEVFDFQAKIASLYLGASGNEGDFGIRDGFGKEVLHFNGKKASLKIGGENNEGDLIILDGTSPTASATAIIDGKTGTLSIKRINSFGNQTLFIDAKKTQIENALNVNGDVTAKSGTINGPLNVKGEVTANSGTINGPLNVNGEVTAKSGKITGDLIIDGNVAFGKQPDPLYKLDVDGIVKATYFEGGLDASKITGRISADNITGGTIVGDLVVAGIFKFMAGTEAVVMTNFINWEKRDPGYHVVYAIECFINRNYYYIPVTGPFTEQSANPF
jgi:cytoskeletal protein CcmA (bactofilin family)